MKIPHLSPYRPYLLRAFYEWLLDNHLTPHLLVDVTLPNVQIPIKYAHDGQIVLNISPRAVSNLKIDNYEVRFNTRFGGVSHQVLIPLASVLAIYSRENGAGTIFEPEPFYENLNNDKVSIIKSNSVMAVNNRNKTNRENDKASHDESPILNRGRPFLRIIK